MATSPGPASTRSSDPMGRRAAKTESPPDRLVGPWDRAPTSQGHLPADLLTPLPSALVFSSSGWTDLCPQQPGRAGQETPASGLHGSGAELQHKQGHFLGWRSLSTGSPGPGRCGPQGRGAIATICFSRSRSWRREWGAHTLLPAPPSCRGASVPGSLGARCFPLGWPPGLPAATPLASGQGGSELPLTHSWHRAGGRLGVKRPQTSRSTEKPVPGGASCCFKGRRPVRGETREAEAGALPAAQN